MPFMQPEIIRSGAYLVDGPRGIDVVPFTVAGKVSAKLPGRRRKLRNIDRRQEFVFRQIEAYCENRTPYVIEVQNSGYCCRMSAPGYLDCTDWAWFATRQEAVEYLDEYYGDDYDADDDDESDGPLIL